MQPERQPVVSAAARGRDERGEAARVAERHGERAHGLQGEVGGEGGLLEGGELRAREDLEGDYAAEEGLEERAAQEGAIAMWMG